MGNVMAPTWRSSWFPPRPAWHPMRPCIPTSRRRHRQRRTARAAPMGGRLNTFANLINQAVEDGAQIISVSQSVSEESPELKWAIANAISKGVIIVASAGNGASDDNVTHLSRFSGVVGVSAINADGTFASYSSWGDGVVTAAFGGPFNTFDPATNQPQTVNGTSVSRAACGRHAGFSAPAVARGHYQPDPPAPGSHGPEP